MTSQAYIDQMRARGWKWDEDGPAFIVGGGLIDGEAGPTAIIGASIYLRNGKWVPTYGILGHSWGGILPYDTPMEAADRAEQWLHSAVRGLPGVSTGNTLRAGCSAG